MHVVLLESVYSSALSKMHEFFELYPKSCRAYLPKRVSSDDLEKYNHPPLMAGGWLLLTSHWVNKSVLVKLKDLPKENLIVYRVSSNKQSNALQLQLQEQGISFTFIDNLNLKEEDVVDWILKQLVMDRDTAVYLYKRYNGYLPKISVAVQQLSLQGCITKAKINKFTEKYNDIPLYVLPNHLLGIDPDFEYAVRVIEQYRFASSYLLEYLRTTFNNYLQVYKLVGAGVLSTQNAVNFQLHTDNRMIKSMQLYHLKHVIESYSRVSIDYLLLLIVQIEKLPSSTIGLYKLVELCKLGGF